MNEAMNGNLTVCLPRKVCISKHMPSLSLVALKLDRLMLAIAQQGSYNCPTRLISRYIPSMAHSERRRKVLELLNTFTIVSYDNNEQNKVYDFVEYADKEYRWAYTSQYIQVFTEVGIWMPY